MKYLTYFLGFLCLSVRLFGSTDLGTVSLSSILAPVEIQPAVIVDLPAPVEPKKEIQKVNYVTISLGDILNRIESIVEPKLRSGGKLSLQSKINWKNRKVPEGSVWDLRLQTPFTPDASGRWYPSVDLMVDGEFMSSHRLPVMVSLFKEVWMLNQNLSRGDLVNPSALTAVIRDVYAERVLPIDTTEDLSEYEVERSLARGRIISWDDLKEQPQVRRNSVVDVIAQRGALNISMRARAMDDGLIGDAITVRNLDTNREFVAFVRGKNRVEFEL